MFQPSDKNWKVKTNLALPRTAPTHVRDLIYLHFHGIIKSCSLPHTSLNTTFLRWLRHITKSSDSTTYIPIKGFFVLDDGISRENVFTVNQLFYCWKHFKVNTFGSDKAELQCWTKGVYESHMCARAMMNVGSKIVWFMRFRLKFSLAFKTTKWFSR